MNKPSIILFTSLLMTASLFSQTNSPTGNNVTTEGMIGATEVRYWDSTKTTTGYTLFAAQGKTYLIDMEGYLINQWSIGTNPRFLDNGNLLDAVNSDLSNAGGLKELDWSGNSVWTYNEARTSYVMHDDWMRIYNKKLGAYTTLYIAKKSISREQALAAGANPASSTYNDVQVDAVVEVDMSGAIVWEWCFFDHIIQNYDSTKSNYVGTGKTIANYPGKININMPGKPLKSDWLHCNSIDYNDSLGHIVINSVYGEFYIINHDGTFLSGNPAGSLALAASSTGDFLYRFGDPARYGAGNPPSVSQDWTMSTTGNKQIGGSHHAQWIKKGISGAGNILVFNNGNYLFERTSQSYIFEVNPCLNASKVNTGSYVNPPTAGYYTWSFVNKDAMKQNKSISNQVVSIYLSKNDQNFFSIDGGSQQRLPNGNMLICSGSEGHMFEIIADTSASQRVVWEYSNPITTDGIKKIITDQYPKYNFVPRAYRYAATHPALLGRTLTRKGTITGKTPQYYKAADLTSTTITTGETELRYWDSTATVKGYTLFAGRGQTFLIDMEGYVINQWNAGTNPRFLDNGNLLDATKADPSGFTGFQELDWSGNVVWTYSEKRTTYFPHHDWTRIYNKKLKAYTTLYIANKNVSKEQALANGANPANSTYTDGQMDAIVEVDMSGNIVWEWWFFDHVIQDFDATKLNYVGTGKTISDYPGRININMPGKPLKKDWLHCNAIDYNDTLGQILVNSVHGELYIIDHDNTFLVNNAAGSIALAAMNAGDFLYRFGDPARYNRGNPPSVLEDWTTSTTGHKQIGGSHDAHWIKPGLPGEGNIQIFNNAEYLFEKASQSYITEINPYFNSLKVNTGKYVNPPDAGYYTLSSPGPNSAKQDKLISNQTVWVYNSKNDQNFFSTIGGSEQRLPNGTTLICSDTQGHLFEVTYGDALTAPRVVWDYVSPVGEDGIKRIITDQYPMYNSVFRAYRYYADHPALKGRTMTRRSTITGRTPKYYRPSDLVSGVNNLSVVPRAFALHQNYPNPFNPETVVGYQIPQSGRVTLKIYDALGREVRTLVNEYQRAGSYSVRLNGSALSSGAYFYQLCSGGSIQTKKCILLK
ncbi:MAG: aryl-sulfate sulfotransferase [Ignavibacteriales bacterium]|nr:aryl-sulfate sulfotransferase [Ignavibacteriales bacterium]